jgi:hypothetical protein
MLKKLKSLIKNKRGDFAIFALIVIPALITIFTTVVTTSYKRTIINSKYQTELDNLCLVASKYYATTYETAGGDFAINFDNNKVFGTQKNPYEYYYKDGDTIKVWNENIKNETIVSRSIMSFKNNQKELSDCFAKNCVQFLRNIDGANVFWKLDIQIVKLNNSDSEALKLQLYYYLPNLSTIRAISNYGIAYDIKDANRCTGWYKDNINTWNSLAKDQKTAGEVKNGSYIAPSPSNFICGKVVSYSTKI